uniref:Ion_trans_2 domain-containing protein n=1 Tax=Steinernema glaseri TaxID=37863 RepID=A0A1I7Y348_9BILA
MSIKFYFHNRKTIGVNCICVVFLLVYVFIGAFVFLHLENRGEAVRRHNQTYQTQICIQRLLANYPSGDHILLASRLAAECVPEREISFQEVSWSLKTAALYSFGILTTLGYGKIEPESINGRIFTVLYGFLGIPITVIIFTNFGRYLQRLEIMLRRKITGTKQNDLEMEPTISASTLCVMVWSYLILGALFIPYLKGKFDFFNGIYFAFLCFTAIEYGELIPDKYSEPCSYRT